MTMPTTITRPRAAALSLASLERMIASTRQQIADRQTAYQASTDTTYRTELAHEVYCLSGRLDDLLAARREARP